MKAIVKSTKGAFETYEIENILSIQYVGLKLVLTHIDEDDEIQTLKYGTDTVYVSVH